MMSRRESLASPAALFAPVPLQGAKGRSVLVIGAGVAGLAAAHMLRAAGHRVTVIEARDRICGRISSSRIWPGVPVDLGASWIHGTRGNPPSALADEAGAERLPTSHDSAITLDSTCRPLYQEPAMVRADAVVKTARVAVKERDQIPEPLAQGLDIRLGPAATAFAPEDDRVSFTLVGGDVRTADQTVVTLAIGVPQSRTIRFAAPLARHPQAEIDGLGMGLLNKCWLRFDRIAWPDDVDWVEWHGPRHGHWAQRVSLTPSLGAPVMLGFNASAQSREIEVPGDAATADAAHATLRTTFGADFPALLAAQVTRWSKDPSALGSHSVNAVRTCAGTRAALHGVDWDGRLFSAGEAASQDHSGTMHGALMPGLAAASFLSLG